MNRLRQRINRLARDLEGETLTVSELMAFVSAVTTTLKRHITDRQTLRAIAADLRAWPRPQPRTGDERA